MKYARIGCLAALGSWATLAGCADIDDVDFGTYCVEREQRVCYDGPPGRAGVGRCRTGMQTCVSGAWGKCTGQVLPGKERCSTSADEDCDGQSIDPEDGCVCEAGTSGVCYTGPVSSLGVGVCHSGTGTCNQQGTGFELCDGQVLPAAEHCDTEGVDESCDGVATCTGASYWSLLYGNGQTQVGNGVAADAAGNVILTGAFEGSVRFGGRERVSAGDLDIYVVKVAVNGEYFWSRRFGAEAVDEGLAVTTDPERNTYLTGSCSGSVDLGKGPSGTSPHDVYVVKLGRSGEYLWSKRTGDETVQRGTAMAFTQAPDPLSLVDEQGYVLVTGSFQGEIDFGCGPLTADGSDVFVVKLAAATGACGWSKSFGGAGDQQGTAIAADATGNVVVAGSFSGLAHIGGATVSGDGQSDLFVVKLDTAGELVWSKGIGDVAMNPSDQVVKGIAIDGHDDVLLTGEIGGTVDFGGDLLDVGDDVAGFVAKLDPAGVHLWSKKFGGAPSAGGHGIAVDGADNVLVTGYFAGSVDFGNGALVAAPGGETDMLAVKLSAAGDPIWSRRFGDGAAQLGRSIAVDGRGNLFLTGDTEGNIDFGGGALTAAGGKDTFLAKLLP